MALRVLICDDAVGFPHLLEVWLNEAEGVEPVGVVATGPDLLERVGTDPPDAVLLDLMLPHGPITPELVAGVRDLAPGVRIVLVSNLPVDKLVSEAQRVGADATCAKAAPAAAFIGALLS